MALLNRAPVLPTRGRVSIKTCAVARPQKAVKKAVSAGVKLEQALFVASTAFIAGPARAEEADDVDSAVDAVIGAVKSSAEFIKSGITTVQSGIKVVKEGYDVAAPVIKQGVDAVSPVVSSTFKAVSDVAAPAIKAAAPVVTDTLSSALESTGLDLKTVGATSATVTKTAEQAAAATTPYLTQVFNFITSTEPVLLAEYALGALALVYLAPALLGSVFRPTLTITAGLALDAVVNEGNIVLVDIRTPKDKEASGIPDVPSAASSKVIEVEYAALEDKKLRGQLRDPGFIEAQTTALQIASLKRIGKGSKVLLLDRYGGATAVARELQNKGFSKVYIIEGGFDGRGGWVQSKLQIKPYFSAFSAPAKIGTRGTKALPAPRSA